jgi:hypothetical protein
VGLHAGDMKNDYGYSWVERPVDERFHFFLIFFPFQTNTCVLKCFFHFKFPNRFLPFFFFY